MYPAKITAAAPSAMTLFHTRPSITKLLMAPLAVDELLLAPEEEGDALLVIAGLLKLVVRVAAGDADAEEDMATEVELAVVVVLFAER